MADDPLILIVDDFLDDLDLYSIYLTSKGYRVLTASSGAEAIAAARANHPALVLMDIRMFRMSGTEAMQHIREDPAFDDVYIIALTAHALVNERAAALVAGFDAVISKPCLPNDLLAAVQKLLLRPRQPDAS